MTSIVKRCSPVPPYPLQSVGECGGVRCNQGSRGVKKLFLL